MFQYPGFDGEFDLLLDGIRVEVKACRANSTKFGGNLASRAYLHQEAHDHAFKYHYQQLKPSCCDVFLWIGVCRDELLYWVISSEELIQTRRLGTQHRNEKTGTLGVPVYEGQIFMTEEELRQLFASLNIDATTARGQVVAFALSCQGKFVYAQPSSLRGGPGNPSVGINLDCSSFVQYCYWAQNLPFSAGSTAAYRNAADLVSISPSEVQPGDLRVVYASGGEQGHVQMALGGGAWIECCYGYGVAVNTSNAWMESRPCYYFRYAGF